MSKDREWTSVMRYVHVLLIPPPGRISSSLVSEFIYWGMSSHFILFYFIFPLETEEGNTPRTTPQLDP